MRGVRAFLQKMCTGSRTDSSPGIEKAIECTLGAPRRQEPIWKRFRNLFTVQYSCIPWKDVKVFSTDDDSSPQSDGSDNNRNKKNSERQMKSKDSEKKVNDDCCSGTYDDSFLLFYRRRSHARAWNTSAFLQVVAAVTCRYASAEQCTRTSAFTIIIYKL